MCTLVQTHTQLMSQCKLESDSGHFSTFMIVFSLRCFKNYANCADTGSRSNSFVWEPRLKTVTQIQCISPDLNLMLWSSDIRIDVQHGVSIAMENSKKRGDACLHELYWPAELLSFGSNMNNLNKSRTKCCCIIKDRVSLTCGSVSKCLNQSGHTLWPSEPSFPAGVDATPVWSDWCSILVTVHYWWDLMHLKTPLGSWAHWWGHHSVCVQWGQPQPPTHPPTHLRSCGCTTSSYIFKQTKPPLNNVHF